MTRNQISYWELQEKKRSNRVNEVETNRHNTVGERETERHNKASEGIDLGKLNESYRHNVATEQQARLELAEAGRHNIATENETNRHNLAWEAETNRHNVTTEGQTDRSLSQTDRQLDLVAQQQAEQRRHNMANEALTGTDLNIKADQVTENVRHNQSTELQTSVRNQAMNDLDRARATLVKTQAEYEGLKNSMGIEYNAAEIREIEQKIDLYKKQIENLDSSIRRNEFRNWTGVVHEAQSILENIGKLGALIGG